MRDLLSIGTSRGCEMIGTGIGLGLSGYRVNPPGVIPVLDLNFASLKSLVAATGPTPSFSRASTGTFFNSSGVLTTAAVNGPRFNHVYNGSSWVSKGLLVEEQRTNNILRSQDLTVTWTMNRGTISSNAAVAPDGTTTADRFVENTANGVHGPVQTPVTTSAAAYTASGFFKAGSRSVIVIRFQDYDTGANGVGAEFNLSAGTISSPAVVIGAFTSPSATISNVGGGWYRCTVTGTANTTQCSFRVEACTTAGAFSAGSFAGSIYTGDGASYFDSWGYQLELGSFPTSYIPTTTAAVTRSADVCQITGSAFTNLWNATEGSFSVDNDRLGSVTSSFSSGFPHSLSLVDGSNLVRMGFYGGHSGASPTGEIFLYNGSSRITAGSLVSGSNPIKISGAYKANDFAASLNGAASLTSSSGALETVVQMNIGAWASSQYMLNGHIARIRYYPNRLTNAKLQELST